MLVKLIIVVALLYICFLDRISGDLTLTVGVFSGQPDPQWQVSGTDPDYKEIQRLLVEARNAKLTSRPENTPARLGYKGFLVQDTAMKKEELIIGPETMKLQQLLLKTAPKDVLPEGNRKVILKEINTGAIVADARVVKRYAPRYFPSWWNGNLLRMQGNNCYNYANARPTGTRALPGRAAAPNQQQYRLRNNAAIVQAAAQADGLQVFNVPPPPQGPFVQNRLPSPPVGQRHLVALVVDPDRPGYRGDFHWYRLDRDGKWSHKPGQTRVTQDDNAGHPVTDPRRANSSPRNYQFVCFMTTDRNNVNII